MMYMGGGLVGIVVVVLIVLLLWGRFRSATAGNETVAASTYRLAAMRKIARMPVDASAMQPSRTAIIAPIFALEWT